MQPTNDDDTIRVSDAEREQAQAHLQEAYVDGRLTREEFSTRVDTALTARTRGDLRALTHDLATTPPVSVVPSATVRIQAIVGENKRTGRWRAAGQVDIVAVMGNCKVDLRDAEIVGPEVVLNVRAVMSDVKIYVPRGLQVIKEDLAILSSDKDTRSGAAPVPGAPVIRVRGFGLMSSVEVTDEQPGRL